LYFGSHSGFLFLSQANHARLSEENGSFSKTSPLFGGRYITGIVTCRQADSIGFDSSGMFFCPISLVYNGYECDRRGSFFAATESTRELGHPFPQM
jgi:hypothetical protein